MRKFIIFLLMFLFSVSAVLVDAETNVKSTEAIQLVMWSHYGESPEFVQDFADTGTKLLQENGYPNATVKAEIIPYEGYQEKFLSAFVGGKGPDIFHAMAAGWAEDGGLNPVAVALPPDLTELLERKLAPYLESWGTYKGKRYGIPSDGMLQLLYINTDHFREVGLDPEKPPRNVDEFIAAAKKLTKYDANGKVIRAGYMPRYLGHGLGVADKFLPIVHIFGGQMLSPDMKKADGYINSPQSVAAFQFYYDLVYKYKVVNLDFGKPGPAFQKGLASMIFREGYMAYEIINKAPNIHFKVYPYISGALDLAPSNLLTWAWMINKDSKYKEVCFDLFRLMTTRSADIALHAPTMYVPVITDTYTISDDTYSISSLIFGDAMLESLKKKIGPQYVHPKVDIISCILGEEMASCLTGTQPKVAADQAAKRIDEMLTSF
ncbi:extracellular solute-binding protein [Candidatus Atribacteria bacterium 1244-E10-H5-B2]|nr:MAG: extracellular solute-binding protein [Candidatus Atribacteria bacterium 1244-E10-H5-B2]